MDTVLLPTVITTVGSIVTAVITGVTTLVIELIKNERLDPGSLWKWVTRLGYPVALLTAAVAGFWVFSLVHDDTASRLTKALPDLQDYKKRIYANVGLGFVYPKTWQIEDYAFRFGGGDLEAVSARDATGLIVAIQPGT